MTLRWESGEPGRISDFLLVLPGGKLRRRTGAAQSGTREMAQSFWRRHTQLGSGGVRTGSTWTKSSAHAGTQGSEDEIWLSAYFCTFWNTATLITYGLWPPLCPGAGSPSHTECHRAQHVHYLSTDRRSVQTLP